MTGLRIGLIGRMHSGKSTVAKKFIDQHNFRRVSLAEPVKNHVAKILTYANKELLNDLWESEDDIYQLDFASIELDKELYRPFLQWYATDYVRNKLNDPNYWTRLLIKSVNKLPDLNYICDDVRFLNEVELLQKHGFSIIRVERDETERQRSILSTMLKNPNFQTITIEEFTRKLDGVLNHPSELEGDQIIADFRIINPGPSFNMNLNSMESYISAVLDLVSNTSDES